MKLELNTLPGFDKTQAAAYLFAAAAIRKAGEHIFQAPAPVVAAAPAPTA